MHLVERSWYGGCQNLWVNGYSLY